MKSLTGIVSAVLLSGCVGSSSLRIGDEYLLNQYSKETPLVCGEIAPEYLRKPDTPICDVSHASDPNYPSLPPIRKPVTIYKGGKEYPPLEERDITDPSAFTTFTDNYPDGSDDHPGGSRVLRLPVQVWPVPTVTSTVYGGSEGVGRVIHDSIGWPLPSLNGYVKTADLGGILCSVFEHDLLLDAFMYEKIDSKTGQESQIVTYSDGSRLVAYSTTNVEEHSDGVFFVDGMLNNMFNMKSSEDTDLCQALELSLLSQKVMKFKK